MSESQVRMSISMTPEDRALIETAAKAAGVSVSKWIVQTAREEARWAIARQITREMADEAGVTAEDEAWARSALAGRLGAVVITSDSGDIAKLDPALPILRV